MNLFNIFPLIKCLQCSQNQRNKMRVVSFGMTLVKLKWNNAYRHLNVKKYHVHFRLSSIVLRFKSSTCITTKVIQNTFMMKFLFPHFYKFLKSMLSSHIHVGTWKVS